jgi:hypothetical protein
MQTKLQMEVVPPDPRADISPGHHVPFELPRKLRLDGWWLRLAVRPARPRDDRDEAP